MVSKFSKINIGKEGGSFKDPATGATVSFDAPDPAGFTSSFDNAAAGSNIGNSRGINPFNKIGSLSPEAGAGFSSATDFFDTIKSKFSAPSLISRQSVFDKFSGLGVPQVGLPTGPQQISGLGNDFFNAERERRKESLREEFFGATGILQQKASEESGAGRLGSGVGRRILESTVTNPFAQAFTGIDRDVGQQQAQEAARVEEFNAQSLDTFADRTLKAQGINVGAQGEMRDFLGRLAQTDSSDDVQAAIANNEINFEIDQLISELSQAESGNLNTFQIELIKAKIDKIFKSEQIKQEWDKLKLEEIKIKLNASNA